MFNMRCRRLRSSALWGVVMLRWFLKPKRTLRTKGSRALALDENRSRRHYATTRTSLRSSRASSAPSSRDLRHMCFAVGDVVLDCFKEDHCSDDENHDHGKEASAKGNPPANVLDTCA